MFLGPAPAQRSPAAKRPASSEEGKQEAAGQSHAHQQGVSDVRQPIVAQLVRREHGPRHRQRAARPGQGPAQQQRQAEGKFLQGVGPGDQQEACGRALARLRSLFVRMCRRRRSRAPQLGSTGVRSAVRCKCRNRLHLAGRGAQRRAAACSQWAPLCTSPGSAHLQPRRHAVARAEYRLPAQFRPRADPKVFDLALHAQALQMGLQGGEELLGGGGQVHSGPRPRFSCGRCGPRREAVAGQDGRTSWLPRQAPSAHV